MPNIPTNDISLNDIHIAIGGTTGTQVSLNDTDVRAATALTLDSAYSNLHGAGINSTSGSIISVHEFRNAFYNTGSITYSLGFSIGDANLNETDDKSAQLVFTATNTSTTDTYYWRIVNGSNDFLADTGSFTTTVGGGGSFTSANFFIQTRADNLTEGTETFDVEVLDPTNTTVLASITVTVADTSITPAATYAGSFDVASINEDGSSTATFNVTTTNVADNTTVGYTITGIAAADISLSSLTGTITITGNSGSVSFTATQDLTTEGDETVTLTLDATDSTGAATNSPSDTVVINDTSTTPAVPSYAGSFDVASIDEDGTSTATFNVTTANVANGTTVGYTISGVSVNDISLSSLTGTITINSNSGSVSFTAVADTTTEGNETVTLTLDTTDSNNDSVGTVSDTVVINDTSTTPLATLSINPTNINSLLVDPTGGTARAEFTLKSNGDFTTFYQTGVGGESPAIGADNWAPAASHAAGFGDDYQVRILSYNSTSYNFGDGSLDNSVPFSVSVSSSNNAGTATWYNNSSHWYRLDADFSMEIRSFTIEEGDFDGNRRMIDIEIKEFDGTNYGSGTTLLTHRLQLAADVDAS